MKSSIIIMTGTLLCLLFLFGCTEPNIDLLNYVNTKVKFEDTPAKNNTKTLASASRAVTASQFEQIYGEFYSKLGNRITFDDKNGLTPTKFRVGVATIYLGHELESPALMLIWTADPENPDEFHADFTAPNSVTTTELIPGEGYVEFVVNFYTANRFTTMAWNDEYLDYIITPEVIVEIPGYTVGDFPDLYSAYFKYQENNPHNCPPLYERKYLENNTFHFTLGFLQPNFEIVDEQVELYRPYLVPENPPDEMDYDLAPGRILPIELFIFSGNADEIVAALPGHPDEEEVVDLLDYLEIDDMGVGTGSSMLKIPFDGLDFAFEDDSNTTIVFNIDLEEIIEVYDYGTPGDKSDDVVIIANNWWDRMSLTILNE